MEESDRSYVFRDEVDESPEYDPEEKEIVIHEGRAMSYRFYRR